MYAFGMDGPIGLGSPPRLAPDSVFITDALRDRPAKRSGVDRASGALQMLAATMVDSPADVLPRFVDLAMDLTGGVAAGLSLYEAESAPDIFEWRHLRGSLARFETAKTPRDHSPCGVTLDCNAPTLTAYPERIYQWIADAGIVVPELLLVPLYIGGAPLGTLWVVSDEDGHFDSGDAKTLRELAGFVGIALQMAQNETQLRQALDEQETVAKEMSHRLKNVFAMADGMIRASARNAETPDAMARTLSGRLHALAEAHAMVRRKVSDIEDGAATTDLAELIHVLILAHAREGDEASPFAVSGPAIACGDHTTNGIALLIHELVTNAAKYGALSVREGHVTIAWTADGDDLLLSWTETGGPVVAGPPTRSGFGTTLADRTIRGQFRGDIAREWRATGLIVRMTLSLDRMAD